MPKIVNIKGDIIPNDNKWIYDWFGWDSTCPNDIVSVINEVNGADDIIIEMNSGGGSVFAAHEIYTAIANYKGNIEIHVVSLAGSAASEILMAAKSKISPVASIMIHNCSTYASGDYRDMDSASNMLKTINQSIRNAYKVKTGLSDEELTQYMDDTTWLGAEKAVELGFVDEIMDLSSNANNSVSNQVIPTLYNATGFNIDQDKIKALRALVGQLPKQISNDNKPMNQVDTTNSQAFINSIQNKGGTIMTLQEVLDQHPELKNEIDAIKVAAKAEGETAERERMQSIDKIAAAVPDEMVTEAKYTNPCTASDLSLRLVENSVSKGQAYIADAISDSKESGVNDVKSDPSAELDNDSTDADDKLADIAAKAANKNRKGVK